MTLVSLSPVAAAACNHQGPCTPRFAKAALKAFVLGYGVQVVFKGAMIAMKKKKGMKKLKEDLAEAVGEDSLRFGAFMGTFVGGYVGLLCTLNRMRGKGGRTNASIAGSVAALAILLDKSRSRRYTIALYMWARAVDTYYERFVRAGRISPLPYGAALLFCLCQVPIMYGFVKEPYLHSKSYYGLILKWSNGITDKHLDKFFRGNEGKFYPCNDGYHKGPCPTFLMKDMVGLTIASGKIYVPLILLPILMFKRKQLVKSPLKVLTEGGEKLARSSLFLATYVIIMKIAMCLSRNTRRTPGIPSRDVIPAGFLTGLSVLWEKQPRHRELVLYVLPRAMEVTFTKVMNSLGLSLVPNGEILLFVLSAAPLLAMLEKHPEHVPHLTKSVLAPLFYPA